MKFYGKLNLLNDITDEEFNEPLLNNIKPELSNFLFESKCRYLKERRSTSLDAFLTGNYQIAIECKFTEEDIGNCSRPKLTTNDKSYDADYCNGSYMHQLSRAKRCSLSEVGIEYWTFIPKLFNWDENIDYRLCPLNSTYQLVRNILAACIMPDGTISEDNGHALLFYDERNPQFQAGGKGYKAYDSTKSGLKNKKLLRKCS